MKSAIQPNYGLRETIRVVLFLSRFQRFLPLLTLSLSLCPLSIFFVPLFLHSSSPALFVNSALFEVSFLCYGKRGGGSFIFLLAALHLLPPSPHDARHPLHIFTIAKTPPPPSWKRFPRARDDSTASESKDLLIRRSTSPIKSYRLPLSFLIPLPLFLEPVFF